MGPIDATCEVCGEPFRWNGTRLPRVDSVACLDTWLARRRQADSNPAAALVTAVVGGSGD